MNEEELKQFIHNHKLAVLCTFGDEFPQSAALEYGDDGLELIIDTLGGSRKHKNILRNPKVSLVIGWDDNKTVQYEGIATILEGAELERCKKLYFAKLPEAQKWESKEGIIYFKIRPKWIRYTDLNNEPWQIKEFVF